MEEPFWPRHPQQSFGLHSAQAEMNCRVEELASALRSSTHITPNRFSWITAEQLVNGLKSHQPRLVVVDMREQHETEGGYITGAIRVPAQLEAAQVDDLVAKWCSGMHLVFTCTRSMSRAPLAARHLLQAMEQMGCKLPQDGSEPRISLLEGGIVSLLEFVLRIQRQVGSVDMEPPASILSEFDPSKWIVCDFPEGPRVAHSSESEKETAENAVWEEEMTDELSFLVDQRMSLSPPSAGAMPYIS
mmetsp:Transcript_3928/g.6162  ORF Transcript_3928/g.6162 Transcript_3928/m.6162 type:complete len:245 (+) Transcript_3928:239-973(+)|eukprot:CAMPEP_0184296010 /NCGR_PEP_ID=MMETSP1049-20130417/6953_1 /TAXON_ID=77928 /ORGANISM="Proteomonas sulcata, Strain CCMP704" /LENGTH=244 /DNA_ID=CAMNT_0026604955 /DNA_START=341 /DNA_END=1075 /DNA_ORIENTATION=+